MKPNLISVICLLLGISLFSSCKKDTKEEHTEPFGAANLGSGRSAIRFTSSESFNNSTSFDVSNTINTSAVTKPASVNATIRQIVLIATEMKDNFLSRKITINIVVPETANTTNGPILIDLSVQAGAVPLVNISLESYAAYLGSTFLTVTSGTLTITKLTATEIEGTFSGTASLNSNSALQKPFTISNGLFAGKF